MLHNFSMNFAMSLGIVGTLPLRLGPTPSQHHASKHCLNTSHPPCVPLRLRPPSLPLLPLPPPSPMNPLESLWAAPSHSRSALNSMYIYIYIYIYIQIYIHIHRAGAPAEIQRDIDIGNGPIALTHSLSFLRASAFEFHVIRLKRAQMMKRISFPKQPSI